MSKAKGERGKPQMYSELKDRVSIALTATACKKLDERAKEENISRSELIERFARGEYLLVEGEEH